MQRYIKYIYHTTKKKRQILKNIKMWSAKLTLSAANHIFQTQPKAAYSGVSPHTIPCVGVKLRIPRRERQGLSIRCLMAQEHHRLNHDLLANLEA